MSRFAETPDPWIAAGRFFDRRRLPTGTDLEVAATNNLLLDLAVVRRLGLRFDAAFGLSGGSDTLFTRELVASGERMVWCDEAIVYDIVPTDRAHASLGAAAGVPQRQLVESNDTPACGRAQ